MLVVICSLFFCFFKQKTAYEMRISDWSSDVCSSDLEVPVRENGAARKLGGWRMIGCWHQSGRVARATRPRKRRRRKPSASLPVQLLASTAASSAGVDRKSVV